MKKIQLKKLQFKKKNTVKSTEVQPISARLNSALASWDLKKLAKLMTTFALLIGVIGCYLWFTRLYMTDERRFWLALENSMSTQSVTRTITSGGTGNQVKQDQQFHFSPQKATKSQVSFTQKSSTVDTSVKTEGVTFLDASYSRYTYFNSNQKKEDGNLINLDRVLGKWEATKATPETLEASKSNYVGEMVTLAVFGNYGPTFKHSVLSAFRDNDTYQITKSEITETEVNGRKAIAIPVSVGLRSFATQLQRAFVESGYGEFAPLNPENYREDARLPASFVINPRDNSIIGIQFGDRQEIYSGYGINKKVDQPQSEFNSGELEAIVQEEIRTAL